MSSSHHRLLERLVQAWLEEACLARRSVVRTVTTLVDPRDVRAVERLVRTLDRGTGIDDLLTRLERIFERFRPTETTMSHLSLMQQRTEHSADATAFCVACVYTVATHVLSVSSPDSLRGSLRRVRSVRSVRSAPPRL